MKLRCLVVALAISVAFAQDPLKTLPGNYHLVFENQTVRVIDVRYLPHEKVPVHNHPDKPTVYVYLTDSGPVRFSHTEAHPFTVIRPPLIAGMFRVSPGRLEKHDVENLGEVPTEFLRVELKQVPLGFQRRTFRSEKPFDLVHSSSSMEFPGPFIKIERIIAARHETMTLPELNDPSLLVAFSTTQVGSTPLNQGAVQWLEPHKSAKITAVDQTAGHLLRITFATR